MIKVSIRLVNGDRNEFTEDSSFGEELIELQRQGYEGKILINTLLTDDWGPPPTSVQIKGTLPDSTVIDISIPYT